MFKLTENSLLVKKGCRYVYFWCIVLHSVSCSYQMINVNFDFALWQHSAPLGYVNTELRRRKKDGRDVRQKMQPIVKNDGMTC